MGAVTVLVVCDEIRLSQIPPDDPLVDVLFGQRKAQTATSRVTQRNAILAIDLRFTLERVLVFLRFLHHHAEPLLAELSGQSLSNFLLHLQAGELDDARAYFAPGLVTPSAELDASIKNASDEVRAYEITDKKTKSEQLDNGQLRETVSGRVRPRPAKGQPTPGPDEGWQQTDIIKARMVERGHGWRILDFELKCCK